MNDVRKKLLVTGAGGFVGKHLLDAVAHGYFGDVEAVPLQAGTDLRDMAATESALGDACPDAVIHLAAQSFVPQSFDDPEETLQINLIGTLHLLQALARKGFTGRFLYVSSGDIYGRVPECNLPVDEALLPEPRNPYAVSKWAAEQLCLQWHRSEKLDVVIARPFNHVGAGQNDRFVLSSLARQVVAIAAGRQPPVIEAGDIDTTRDFSDVRDVVSAYASLLARGKSGETYIVASGVERRVRDLLVEMCRLTGIEVEVRQDPAKMRPAEQRRMVASSAKLQRDTGWAQAFDIQSTLSEILEHARKNQ
ncbi:GDP-mannose 4,6-dehydratase [Xanthomonas sacchari]|uniref:NAD-dependent dehydratase n=1 Tax=Xanthomonas sacchari TaxID=56458 RepID=A0A2P5Z2J1_9XANT|nr:GDP-mannose 4,6-dehydratase [Xanthomonas sacchari]MDV0438940.1 GDP-mannose 4,6-dehydratase [Xanthomonas sacchari]PPU81862.1 NAD-dependent dehydratase [Xanthomonas sacchari]